VGYRENIDDEDQAEPIPDVDVSLVFQEGGSLVGNAGCNDYGGEYETDGVQLIIQNIASNRAQCEQPEGIMEQEVTFLTILEESEEYRITEDGELVIVRFVMENEQRVEKLILRFADR
jgi:heat shock protein HslJ